MMILRFGLNVLLAIVFFVPCSLFGQVTFETNDQYNIGDTPYALQTGDFNNDGWPDMVSANLTFQATKHVSLAINNKAGGFTITNLTALKGYSDLETGFFNNDANLDFVAASLTLDQITIFLGNGNGTFTTANINAGDGPLDILTGDFNEDTKLDIAVLHQSSDDIYIFYGDGSGGVGAPQIIPVSPQAERFVVADFNNNTHLDFVVGGNTTLNFYAGDGAGNFAAAVPSTGFFGFNNIKSVDINGDGNMDILAAGSSNLAFRAVGAGDGTFSGPSFFPEGGLATIAADFDNDGDLDVVSTKQQKFIYYPGDGSGAFPEYWRVQMERSGRGMVAADWNQDGYLDLAMTGTITSTVGTLQVLFGKGNGYFKAPFQYPIANNPRGLTIGDFDEDGLEDLAFVANGSLYSYKGLSNGTFTQIDAEVAGTLPYDVEALHINADTHIDLAVLDVTGNTVNLFSGDGTGMFASAGNFAIVADFEMTVSDVNKDNITDIIIAGAAANNVQIFEGDGNGAFSLLIDLPIGLFVQDVKVADVNGDTNPDLAVLYRPVAGPRKVAFFQGDGSGGFAPAGTDLVLLKGGETFSMEDFNNDGDVDFLSLASDGDVFLGNGDFTFSYSSTNTGVSLSEHSTEVKDIDGDGIKDLISGSDCSFCSGGGLLQVNRGFGDGTFSSAFWQQRLVGGYRMIVSDFNNDGKNDIAALENNLDFDGLSILLNTSGPPVCNAPMVTV
ncbi:MAG: VCBS repeat-containing protein, partial [Cyclobacteriaceae bacterium]